MIDSTGSRAFGRRGLGAYACWRFAATGGVLLLLAVRVLFPAVASAQAPAVTPQQTDAPAGFTIPVGPGGGELSSPSEGVTLRVPPSALEQTVELALEYHAAVPAGLPADVVALGGWSFLTIGDNPLPEGTFGTPWQATVRYGACEADGSPLFCTSEAIDETSLHCLHRASADGAWVRTLSSVEVLSRLLICSDAGSGDYVVAARALETSGETSESGVLLLLPLVRSPGRLTR